MLPMFIILAHGLLRQEYCLDVRAHLGYTVRQNNFFKDFFLPWFPLNQVGYFTQRFLNIYFPDRFSVAASSGIYLNDGNSEVAMAKAR